MGATYYIQICSTCGRRLEVKIEYIGLEVSCYHCRARFVAENMRTLPLSGLHGSGTMVLPKNEGVMSYCDHPSAETVSLFS